MAHRERKYSSTASLTYDCWDGDDRLRTVKQGATSVLTAGYDGDGLRTSKSDSWTGVHTYTWGPTGIVYDNNTGVTTTPGFSKRQSGVDRFFHTDCLGSTRRLSEITGKGTRIPPHGPPGEALRRTVEPVLRIKVHSSSVNVGREMCPWRGNGWRRILGGGGG